MPIAVEGHANAASLQPAVADGLPVSLSSAKLVHYTLLGQVPFTGSSSHAAASEEATDSATDALDKLS